MTTSSPAVDHDSLIQMLSRLKLTAIRDQLDSLLDDAARRELTLRETLAFLCQREVARKDERRIEMASKIAHFPTLRDLDGFDFAAQPSLDRGQIRELAACRWIAHGDALLLLGPSGTGKSHVALGLGLAACQKGLSVGFTTAAALVNELLEARDEKRLLRLQRQLAAYKLLVIDELGYVPLSQTGAKLLFEVFSQRYERGSTIVTSNLPFDEWTSVFASERLTGALLDRLTHHVHILEMNGDSYRLKQSKRRQCATQPDDS